LRRLPQAAAYGLINGTESHVCALAVNETGMYLKNLELFGFKSFPLKTTLKFDSGITVIVGPNGCGKSNVFDAIKWALGEQSPKSLRGSKMEDVIFNGTAAHPPLNYAEVTLIFSNEDKYLSIDYKEVAITRRLYRSGESQYFINRNMCRLRDIQDLFLGTGVGESSYSFIEQGRVEALLSYKPEEKRLIFDEASGIIKYKDKKRETLRKLKDTEDNILRLDDIIQEVQRQIRYLERQVDKAKKYSQVQEELIGVEKKIAVLKIGDTENRVNKFLEEINRLKEKEGQKKAEISQKASRKEEIDLKIKEVQQSLENVNLEVISANSRIESYNKHIEIDTQRIDEITRRLKVLEDSLSAASQRAALHKERLEKEKTSLSSFDSHVEALHTELGGLKEALQVKINQIGEAKKNIAAEKDNILSLEEQKTVFNNSLIEIGAHLKNLLARKKRLSLDEARINSYLAEQSEKYNLINGEVEGLRKEFDSLKEKKGILRAQLKETESQIEQLGQKAVETEKTIVELNSYLEFLKDLKIKYEEFHLKKKVTIVFDEEPKNINKLIASLRGVEFHRTEEAGMSKYKADVEAKIISLPEEELERRISALTKELEKTREYVKNNKEKREQLNKEIDEEADVLSEKDKILRGRLQEKETIEEAIERFNEERSLLEDELSQCRRGTEEAQAKKASYENEASSVENKLSDATARLNNYQESISSFNKEISSLEVEIAKKEAQIKASAEQKGALLTRISLLEEEENSILNSLAAMEDEKKEIVKRKALLEHELISLRESVDKEKDKAPSFNGQKDSLSRELNSLEQNAADVSEELKNLEGGLEALRSDIYTKKLDIQKLDFEKSKIVDYLKQVYNIAFAIEKEEVPAEPIDVLNEKKEKLKNKMDSMGEVNLVAINEFQELKERYDFLITQKGDLTASKDSLKKAIQKINRTSKDIFLDTFNKIEEEFKKYFRFLFGGGRAQLVLLDKDNVLDSGVEIEVQPPGKKLQSALLLSGGEKALTAIALIFSIFKVRPSPLCVLDEIDAPLDEANVDRFNQLLVEFSPAAQFITITHNKKTMSKADVLYGVTMEEKGISKLVSVRFAEKEMAPH